MSSITENGNYLELHYEQSCFNEVECDIEIEKSEADEVIADCESEQQKISWEEAKGYVRGMKDVGFDIYQHYECEILDAFYDQAREEYLKFCEVNEERWEREAEKEHRAMLKDYYDSCL